MSFLTEPEPARGIPLDVLPGIRRIVARNPSVMTYFGTNTYLIDSDDGLTVLDPGPDDATHVADILAGSAGMPIKRLVLTHTHRDHSGAVAKLKAATGAPVYGYQHSGLPGFEADFKLDKSGEVAGLKGLFTPGHAPDHLCFEFHTKTGQKILFSGDHVMSWSSSIVSPPDGNMLHYYRSLELLLDRDEELYLGGHGPILPEPRRAVAELLSHRQYREQTILAQLQEKPWSVGALAAALYNKADPFLKVAAQRNVLAHLQKLHDEGIVEELDLAVGEPDYIPSNAKPPEEEREHTTEYAKIVRRDSRRRFGMISKK